MGRLVDINDVCKAIGEEWYGCIGEYLVGEIIDDTIHAVEQVEEVEAIPVPWIEVEIKKLRDMDNEFATMTAGLIEAMLKRWKEEQEEG